MSLSEVPEHVQVSRRPATPAVARHGVSEGRGRARSTWGARAHGRASGQPWAPPGTGPRSGGGQAGFPGSGCVAFCPNRDLVSSHDGSIWVYAQPLRSTFVSRWCGALAAMGRSETGIEVRARDAKMGVNGTQSPPRDFPRFLCAAR